MIIKDNSRGVMAIDGSLANYSPYTRPYLRSEFVAKAVLDSDAPETFISFTYVFVISMVQSLTSGKESYDKKRAGTKTLFNFINEIIKLDFNPTIIVLLADELHALSLQAEFTMPLDELRSLCRRKSKEYSDNFHNSWLTRPYRLSFWGEWKRGENGQRFEEILGTLRTKISEQPVFEDELGRTVSTLFNQYLIQYKATITERAAMAQIPIAEQKKIERERVTPFFVDFALEQMAVIQLIAEKMGQCNIFFPGVPNQSLYTLRDFWSALSDHPSTNGPPFQIFETSTAIIEKALCGPARLNRFVNEIGVKLIITDSTTYLSIPVEPPKQRKYLSPDNVASSQCLPTTEPGRAAIDHRPWSLYFNILADLLCHPMAPQDIKKLILIIIQMHYRTYQLFKGAALPHYMAPLPLFTPYKVKVEPDVHNPHSRCSSTYVFVFSIVDALLADRGYHSVECIKATVNFINDLVASDHQAKVIILLADELQALNAQAESDLTLQELRQVHHNKGAAWFSRTKLYFDKINGGYKLYHWGEWIGGRHQQRFQEIVLSYQNKLHEYPDFERAALQTYTPYLEKCLKSSRRERGIITPFFAAYPLEETAVIQSMIETLGSINLFYPRMLNPTLYYLRDFWNLLAGGIQKKNPGLPFISFQIPCVTRKSITGVPQLVPTARYRADFPFSFNHHRLFQALPVKCRLRPPSSRSNPDRADSTHKAQANVQPSTPSNSAMWIFSLGSIVKYLYAQSVTDEEKQEIVNSLWKRYYTSDDEDEGYRSSQFYK